MPSMRPQLRAPTYRSITQGTVFCCARASRYEKCTVQGLVITARCDVAQRKYPVLNYLPIVSLPDWLRRDGLDILVETEIKRQSGDLHRLLLDKNISPSLASSIPIDTIADTHFPHEQGSRSDRKLAQQFRGHIALMKTFCSVRQRSPDNIYSWFCDNRPSEVQAIIHRLSRHMVLGHYFLESLNPETQQSPGFVCLLREVFTLPRPIAERLGSGLTAEECSALCDESNIMGLSFDKEDFAMPIVEITSPTIEHILQSFSNLFGRIGVPEPVAANIATIVCLNMLDKRSPK